MRADGVPARDHHHATEDAPIVLLSYGYSGAEHVQNLLATGTGLACTSSTGIIPLCQAAAETWQRVEGHAGEAMSRLAVSTLRGLVTAQVTAILAGAGESRWCELATANPGAAQPFLRAFPEAAFVCVHRNCLDVIRTGVAASPWGLYGQGLGSYLLLYPGNSVAILAAYWVNRTEELLNFESVNPQVTCRVRYEDVTAQPDEALAGLRSWLRLGNPCRNTLTEDVDYSGPDAEVARSAASEVPVELIPIPLHQRINRLHAELGYPPLSEATKD